MKENELSLDAHLEALLFYKGEPVKKSELRKIFAAGEDELERAIDTLKDKLVRRGICLVVHDEHISLGTAPEASALIEQVTKEEITRDLGRAGLETLSIVLYKGPVSRREIDYIRGVNSSFILRNLLIRGLIERGEEQGSRGYMYSTSTDLLMHLGLRSLEDLPEYSTIKAELENFGAEEQNKEN